MPSADAAATPGWQRWGKYAMFAGAAGAVAASAGALYSQREKLSAGWTWATSHLLFVGDLAKAETLKKRVVTLEKTCQERGIGCANMYTNLGQGAREGYGITDSFAGKDRTFCNLPVVVKEGKGQPKDAMKWYKTINEKAKDETTAHVTMFLPRDNPGFYSLNEEAKELITSWIDQGWYNGSEDPENASGGATLGEVGDGWEKPDYNTDDVRDKEKERDNDSLKLWEGLDDAKDLGDDVKMEDEVLDDEDKENMEASVIVDKAADGKVPLPESQEL